jgi:hypothetical protein
MVVVQQLVLGATVKRVSDVYGGVAGEVDQAKNIPYRQLIISATGAPATIGSLPGVTAATGYVIPIAGPPLVLGPFGTGPLKLSDLYGIGAGATITVVGVPF